MTDPSPGLTAAGAASSVTARPFHPALTKRLLTMTLTPATAATTSTNGAMDRKDDTKLSSMNKRRRISPEAVVAAGELLRQFVTTARHRAGIEAECEMEGTEIIQTELESKNPATNKCLIRADHITKIAGELLMDFS